jgi:peptidoglycan/xylan/chitin deacetylase (PgdA/CDA1 family)
MDDVVRYAKPVSLKNGLQLETGRHCVAVTFDDGFSHTMRLVLPELVQRKIPATIFVPSGFLGKQPSWIKNHKSPDYHEVVMTADQLKVAKGADLISIGSHCVTHRSLLSLEEKEAYQEILNSKKTLEAILGERIDLLSFPHGEFHEGHIKIAREAGYRRAFSIVPRLASSETDEYVTGRVRTDPSDWPFEFRLKLFGAYRWVPFAFKLKKMSRRLVNQVQT